MAVTESKLKYFMRPEIKEAQDEIVEVEGFAPFADENGKLLPWQVRVLSRKEANAIREKYVKRRRVHDKKGNLVLSSNGEVAFETVTDVDGFNTHLLIEALVFPNLKDEDLQKYYGVSNSDDLVDVLFRDRDLYAHALEVVIKVNGATVDDDEENEVKN